MTIISPSVCDGLVCAQLGCSGVVVGECAECGAPTCEGCADGECGICPILDEPMRCEGCNRLVTDADFPHGSLGCYRDTSTAESDGCELLLCPSCYTSCPCQTETQLALL